MFIIRFMLDDQEQMLQFDSNLVDIGREPNSTNYVNLTWDVSVSRQHARLYFDDGTIWLQDMGSKRGTFVDNVRITEPTALSHDSIIKIGKTELVVAYEVATDNLTAVPATEFIYHAELRYEYGQPLLTNIDGVENRIWVNDIGLDQGRILHEGDTIQIDTQTIHVGEISSFPKRSTLEMVSPFIEDTAEDESGEIEEVIDSKTYAEFLESDDETHTVTYMRQRLNLVYELQDALSSSNDISMVGDVFLEKLFSVLPSVQSAGLVIYEDGRFLPKAYRSNDGNTNTKVSTSLMGRAYREQEAFIWRHSDQEVTQRSLLEHGTECAIYAPLVSDSVCLGVVFAQNADEPQAFHGEDLRLLMTIAGQVASFMKVLRLQSALQSEKLYRANLLRYFSPQVAEHIMSQRGALPLGGERKDLVTILISDVRGFTSQSAQMSPEDVVDQLNELFGTLAPIVFEFDGTIDKYIGDAILAVFGSPQDDPNHELKAISAALKMQEELKKTDCIFEIGIGLHVGEVVHGLIGSRDRMEYTVIGNTVNRASRYCDAAQKGEVIISDTLYERVFNKIEVSERRIVPTKHPERERDLIAYVINS